MDEARRGVPQDLLVVQCGDEHGLETLIHDQFHNKVHISNVNSSRQILVAGTLEALQAFSLHLEARQIPSRPLGTGMAFHSPLLRAASDSLAACIDRLEITPPGIPFFCLEADRCLDEPEAIRRHLRTHLLERVQWRRAMTTVSAILSRSDGSRICEIGSAKTLKNIYLNEYRENMNPSDTKFIHCLEVIA